MVKLVIHCSDVHIRAKMRFEEYAEQLSKFVNRCQEIASKYEKDEVRIVISGDLFHQKNTITPELIVFVSSFIRQLEQIAKVIVIAGNHDLIVNNTDKKDALTSIFETAAFSNSYFLDYELGFDSGFIVDDNITWVVYSIYRDYMVPDVSAIKKEQPNNIMIGLFHGMINGCKLDNQTTADCGTNKEAFIDCKYVMAGDIHKRQEIVNSAGTRIVYPGSLIQQTFGETVSGHGFAVWDLENDTLEFEDIPSEHQLINIRIEKDTDIQEDAEVFLNV